MYLDNASLRHQEDLETCSKRGKFHRTRDILRVIVQVHKAGFIHIVDYMCDMPSRNGVLNLPRRSPSSYPESLAAPPAVVK